MKSMIEIKYEIDVWRKQTQNQGKYHLGADFYFLFFPQSHCNFFQIKQKVLF